MSYQSLSNSLYNPSATVGTSGSLLSLSDTTQSTGTDSGALIVSGGAGIGKDVFIGGDLTVTGTVTSSGAGSGGMTYLSLDTSLGTSTSITFDNTVITSTYKRIELLFRQMSSDATASFRVELSGNNGSSWGTAFTIKSSVGAGTTSTGRVTIDRCEVPSAQRIIISELDGSTNIGGTSNITTGDIDAIRISPSSGSFDDGEVTIIGWN